MEAEIAKWSEVGRLFKVVAKLTRERLGADGGRAREGQSRQHSNARVPELMDLPNLDSEFACGRFK
jgi:hypothetical protein